MKLRRWAAVAFTATLAACTSTPTTPASTVDDATQAARAHLSEVVVAVLASDPAGQLAAATPADSSSGPCPEADGQFLVSVAGHVLLPLDHQQAAVTAATNQLADRGYTVWQPQDPADAKTAVELDNPSGFTARIASTPDGTALAVAVTSPCYRRSEPLS